MKRLILQPQLSRFQVVILLGGLPSGHYSSTKWGEITYLLIRWMNHQALKMGYLMRIALPGLLGITIDIDGIALHQQDEAIDPVATTETLALPTLWKEKIWNLQNLGL